jgi:hypothetical protein
MGLKILVWSSILFLLGGIAAITYLTFGGNYKSANRVPEPVIHKVKYVYKAEGGIAYSINQIDSLTAADNYYFTKANAIHHPLSKL